MPKAGERVMTRSVNTGRDNVRIAREMYDAMRKAILAVVPRRGEGLPFERLPREVARRLPKRVFAGASIPWYATVVKLDLETRGEIHRVPGSKPQRLLRGRA
jgi:hypothetical protein